MTVRGDLRPAVQMVTADGARVLQRSDNDCMLCCVAMMAELSYEAVERAAALLCSDYDPYLMPMPHGLMRQLLHAAGQAAVTSIYMDWSHPAIVGVPSLLHPGFGHALFWTGDELIDPGPSGLYTLQYVHEMAVEFTQRAQNIGLLVAYDRDRLS